MKLIGETLCLNVNNTSNGDRNLRPARLSGSDG